MAEKWLAFYQRQRELIAKRMLARLDEAQRAYWSDEANRLAQAERVQAYFEAHPEVREAFSQAAKAQWQDEALLEWRREKTREQWTPEFREKRLAALNETYYRKTMAALKQFEMDDGIVDVNAYSAHRLETSDKSLLRFDKFSQRYFAGMKSRCLRR